MTLPLIPTSVLAISCILVVVLAIPALITLPKYSREQLMILFALGVIFLAVGFSVYGGLYFWYTTYIIEIEVRQRTIRFALMFLTLIVNTWLLVVIFFKKGNKK